ncbi:MAG: hypothetical protein RIC55_32345 [Pirellulaceae bacterium]
MPQRALDEDGDRILEQVLGYLNFSSGAPDPQFLANLNQIYERIGAPSDSSGEPPWRVTLALLEDRLESLHGTSPTFGDATQAAAAIGLLRDHVLPGYLAFHRDLLFHQSDRSLFGPFMLGRVFEAALAQGPAWDETERIRDGAIAKLNDYLGHRPVATLESQRHEPYTHEWVRPLPLFVRGAGVSSGPHQEVVEAALKLLEETDEDLLRAAFFAPANLDELAVDPRAYDFDHPVNKRPNYHFGQWDPHLIDNQGNYRRFVVQQVTLDALMQRVVEPGGLPHDEVVFEAAAVLAGTMLMASGVSGSGPDSHGSNVTLANLLPGIAAFRDAFYERLFTRTSGRHAERLRKEAKERRQPFGGARQHLNAQLARRRASQLEHVQLARVFARMGFPAEAARQADVVPTASARILCRIDCLLVEGRRAIEDGQLAAAESILPKIVDYMHRAIECGAIVDPWNILGFDAHFSLFPALENSVHDHRVDDLIMLMEQLFAFYARIWSEAAARDEEQLCERVSQQFQSTASWWRKFAAHEVTTVECADALDMFRAAEHVARALNLWHKGGAATGDVAFWAPHAAMFDSPKAYALVVEALLDRGDFVASMALLTHWIGQLDRIPLEQAESSFHQLAQRWLVDLRRSRREADSGESEAGGSMSSSPESAPQTWKLVCRFLDYLEANAEEYWRAPRFLLGEPPRGGASRDASSELFADTAIDEDSEQQELFSAAYEDMVFRDSTDDGVEGEVHEGGGSTDDELERESRRISDRLALLETAARLWSLAVLDSPHVAQADPESTDHSQAIGQWIRQATANLKDLSGLLERVESHRIPAPSADHDSLVEYDRRRALKESLLERIIVTCVETADTQRLLLAVGAKVDAAGVRIQNEAELEPDQASAVVVLASVLRRDAESVRRDWPDLIENLARRPLLYVPLAKGGSPKQIVAARVRQRTIQDLLCWAPRLGLLVETCRLVETAREMERNNPVGPGAVTEFDELFKIGYSALVEMLVDSASKWEAGDDDEDRSSGILLVDALESLTESLLISWLAHSRTLRLSVLEKVKERVAWRKLVTFIDHYGADLFTQRFFSLGNVRAILHQGVATWLAQVEEAPPPQPIRLLDDLEQGKVERSDAVEHLTLVLESIIENYSEYRDYNSTTTQSDRGELLYSLLDFLRLRTAYERVAWQLKPVVWAHEILVRCGRNEAAELWRSSLAERFGDEADKYLRRLAELQKKYAMRMPTVADRLAERFIGPMHIDRICALVAPAIEEAGQRPPHPHFELLLEETESLTQEPTGVGLDMPAWLMALAEEVEQARRPVCEREPDFPASLAEPLYLSQEELDRQIDEWGQK